MEFKEEILRALEGDELWTVLTFKTPHGPGVTLQKLADIVEEAGWKVLFKANWWTADIPYGLARLDLKKGEKEKILLGKWILGDKFLLIKLENLSLEQGREEFFRMVDSIASTLIHDPVIRTMREQY
ncbi:ribonucleoside-triphosphate reductase [Thermococcus waiotapuensis]|uniref:Ribonucleoside-triphosphate reductase n=1 Tax=Thermococcus waiotapuensis TaxID=90909 RepID=A0AAE4NXD3_9EURY|nr:ribonucleoside-triphosphate reductase [Thermococcus waiotapuensis]MDV3104447.1 ribonucleoside-triphosphate reductase [Thermococcus waiotapuensis]